MGYDQQPNSSGNLVAVIGGGLVLAILTIIAVAGVGLFWVRASRMESRDAVVAEQRAIDELRRAELEARVEQRSNRIAEASGPRLNFELKLDREGSLSVAGEVIGFADLRSRLAEFKDKSHNTFFLRINADPACPIKHIIPVLDVCEAVGDIDYRIVSSSDGTDVRMTATVASYEPAAEWDHFDDGTFSAYDSITLKVVAPERYAGAMFSVTVPPTEIPDNSALRNPGTRLSFTVQTFDIAATGLSWGAIDNPTVEQ